MKLKIRYHLAAGFIILLIILLVALHSQQTTSVTGTTDEAKTNQLISFTYANPSGETIIYHVFYTPGSNNSVTNAGINPVIHEIINPDTADTSRTCNVSGFEAVLCSQGKRSYLCWTASPEYSMVIEYTSGAVPDSDILRMAESIPSNLN